MSAQDYYNQGGSAPAPTPAPAPAPTQPIPVPQQNHQQPPPPPVPPLQNTPPYPLYDGPPPPYSPGFDQRPHSQPPPAQRVDAIQQQQQQQPQYRPSNLSAQYRPQPQPHSYSYEYPPEKQPYPAHDDYRRDPYAQPNGQKPQHDRRTHSNSKYPPSLNGNGGQYQSIYRGRKDDDKRYYDEDYERRNRSRSRSRSRSRGRDRDVRRKHVERKKSSGVNTFLGAGGGALIGDMIFPGLGTIGGALLGGVGGHEYGKSRSKTHHERSPVSSGRRTRRYSNEEDAEYRRRKY